MFRRDSYDAVVIGAGPGGCATAAIAARHGLQVLLLDRSPQTTFKVGESLIPDTYFTLERMGALDRMRRSSFPEKHSVQFYARNGRASTPFYFSKLRDHESSRTWQVLRSEFDHLLFCTAADQGAECWRGVGVKEILFEGDRAVGVRVEGPGIEARDVACKVVVDASGQSGLLTRRLGIPKHSYGLDNAAVWSHFRGAQRDPGLDEGATLVLRTSDSEAWFWYIPLPEDIVSVGVVGSLEHMVQRRTTMPHDTFWDEVDKCPEVKSRLRSAQQMRPIMVVRDFSYRHEQMAGDGWILVGDAYQFIDPLYSSGVLLALKGGEMAADAIAGAVAAGDVSAAKLAAHESTLRGGAEAICTLVKSFYNPEFSFGDFLREYPHLQRDITRILVGDVMTGGFDELWQAMDRFQLRLREVGAATAATTA
jgi:flavin-dependent dehydrogenase